MIGVGKGSVSLLRNSVFALFGSASKIIGSVGSGTVPLLPCFMCFPPLTKGVAKLTFDDEYQARRQKGKVQQSDHALEGVGRGLLELGSGIFDGVTGIVTQPIKGAQAGGAGGFFAGVGRGLLGAVVKPTVGVLDFASRTTEGIKNTPDVFKAKARPLRKPRHFSHDRALRPYSEQDAAAQSFVRHVNGGKYEAHRYECTVPNLEKDSYLIITDKGVILLSSSDRFILFAAYREIQQVEATQFSSNEKRGDFRDITRYVVRISLTPKPWFSSPPKNPGRNEHLIRTVSAQQAQMTMNAIEAARKRAG